MGYCVPMWRGDTDPIGHIWRGNVPNITASLDNVCMYPYNGYGAFSVGTSAGTAPGPNSGSIQRRHLDFNASWSNGVYDSNNTGDVFPRNMKMYQIIKY